MIKSNFLKVTITGDNKPPSLFLKAIYRVVKIYVVRFYRHKSIPPRKNPIWLLFAPLMRHCLVCGKISRHLISPKFL